MDNRIKIVLYALIGLVAAYFLAAEVGQGNYLPAILLGLVLLAIGGVMWLFPNAPFDGSMISLGIVGVMLTGKGYSYLGVGGVLYITEIVLACALVGYLSRVLFQRDSILPTNPLIFPLLCLIGYMVFHLYFDRKTYGLLAFRDACVIYYSGFFFAAYKLAAFPTWRIQFKRLVLLSAPFAIFIMALQFLMPSLIYSAIHAFTFQGRPIFFPHGDAADNAFLGGILFCLQFGKKGGIAGVLCKVAIALLLAYLAVRARGVLYVSVFAMMVFLVHARQWTFFRILIPAVLVGIAAVFIAYSYSPEFQHSSRVQRVMEELESFEVLSENDVSGSGAATASWRLEWWDWIYRTVSHTSPIYGLGLGADLYIGFARDVLGFKITADQSTVRGAHSALFTIMGRMGFLGAVLVLWAAGIQLWYFHKAAIMWRRLGPKLDPFFLYLQGAMITFFCTTFLQYTWEGPYSALPFWVFSGVSYYLIDQYYKGKVEPEWEDAALSAGTSETAPPLMRKLTNADTGEIGTDDQAALPIRRAPSRKPGEGA